MDRRILQANISKDAKMLHKLMKLKMPNEPSPILKGVLGVKPEELDQKLAEKYVTDLSAPYT